MIRSLSREVDKNIKSEDVDYVGKLKRDISRLERNNSENKRKYDELYCIVHEKLGRKWIKENTQL